MRKVVRGVFLAMVVFAIGPVPSKVITVTVSNDTKTTGSIVVSESKPPDTILFEDAQELLTSITTENFNGFALCSL